VAITVALFLPGLSNAGNVGNIVISNQISPTWNQTIDNPRRFQLVLGNQGVMDKETGLVWQKNLDTTSRNWYDSQVYCNTLNLGSRMGWRVPTLQELTSLVDQTQTNPPLPSGHPFANVQNTFYWVATTKAIDTSAAWLVSMHDGDLSSQYKSVNYYHYVWCVRGGQGVDPQ
jgi:hypothetical protein